mgnify:CR=1 FL=1
MKKTLWMAIGLGAAVLLGGCTETRNVLGLNKRVPDEFAVYSRAPLSLPPDFGLRPPEPGSSRPQREMPEDDARKALAGGSSAGGTQQAEVGEGAGVQALLKQMGAQDTDPNIRLQVNQETSFLAEESKSFADTLLFWRDEPTFETVVDAQEEAKRLQEAKALGKPLNETQTPTISKERRSVFEGLF